MPLLKLSKKGYLMKCLSCDVILTPFESTRKYKSTGDHVDLCNACFKPIADQVPVVVRHDLVDLPDDDDEYMDDTDV